MGCLGDAEIHDLYCAVEGHQDVLRTDVSMDDPCVMTAWRLHRVGVMHALTALGDDAKDKVQRDELLAAHVGQQKLPEVSTLDVLHGDVVGRAHPAQIESLRDIGVVQIGGNAPLVQKHFYQFRIVDEALQDGFDDHTLGKAGNPFPFGQPDLAHAAHGKSTDKLVIAELFLFLHSVGQVQSFRVEGNIALT